MNTDKSWDEIAQEFHQTVEEFSDTVNTYVDFITGETVEDEDHYYDTYNSETGEAEV